MIRNLKCKYAAAYNFLPFGPEGIQLDFTKFRNIILVHGENRDAKILDSTLAANDYKVSSNGTGKSSLQEIISVALYGKTIKRHEKIAVKDVVHNKIKRDCKVEFIFDKYRIVRTRMEDGKKEKNRLRLWESEQGIWNDDTEITQGTVAATQKKIDEIVGLSYDAFINICIFTDDQRSCFLESETAVKREIVEDLLALGVYRGWFENAKELVKTIKASIEQKAKEYALLLGGKTNAENRLKLTQEKQQNWYKAKKDELAELEKKIAAKAVELKTTDAGQALFAYQQAQQKIKEINDKIPDLEAKEKECRDKLQIARDKENQFKETAQKIKEQHSTHSAAAKAELEKKKAKEQEIADLEARTPGAKCGWCKGVVEEHNIQNCVAELHRDIADITLEFNTHYTATQEVAKKAAEIKAFQDKAKAYISQFEEKKTGIENELRTLRNELVAASKVREPKADSAELLLQQQIEEFNRQLEAKKQELAGASPFDEILENDKNELKKALAAVSTMEVDIKALEDQLPYYNYWLTGFGEKGIRKWVVDGIIPELNTRVNYWLQFLIENMITLKFDNELKETIERNPPDGDPYVYHAMSTGQRRRLNLAVSQSFAHIMALSSDAIPSVVFLDEVSTNIDPLGVQGIYNMILELAEDKQVFVTTHDADLVRMLQGADVINLVHENGFTKMV